MIEKYFFYLSTKTYIVGCQKTNLNGAILLGNIIQKVCYLYHETAPMLHEQVLGQFGGFKVVIFERTMTKYLQRSFIKGSQT